jgi:hypothetical protein
MPMLPALTIAIMDQLRAALPPPLYSFATAVLSNAYTAATAFARLSSSLMGEKSTEAILPPIITILAAYIALASLYRTASWALRLSLFFLKWGTLIGVAMAVAGYLAGSGADLAANQTTEGVVNVFSGLFGGESSPKHKWQTNRRRKERPRPWQSFETWQYQEQPKVPDTNPSAQQLMDSIVRAAEGALGGSWWSAAMNSQRTASTEETQSRGKNGKTRSR